MKNSAALLFTLGIILIAILPPIAGAQARVIGGGLPKAYVNVTETNATVVVSTEYNEIIINKTSSTISAILLNSGDYIGTRVNPRGIQALDIIYAFNNTRGRVQWTKYDVVKVSDDRARITLTGTIGNETVTLTLLMGAYRPYIDLVAQLPERPGFYYIILPVNESLDQNWIMAMTYYSSQGLTPLTTKNLTLEPTGYGLDALAMLGVTTTNKTTRLDLVFGYSNLPGYISPIEAGALQPKDVNITPYNTAEKAFYITAAYGGASRTVGIRLLLAPYDPYAILAAGVEEPVKAAYPRADADYRGVIYENLILDRLNKTLTLMKNRLKNLTALNEKLEKNISTCKGCQSYWSNELHVKELTIKRLQERLRADGLLAEGAFFLGIILGVAGGYYVIGAQKKKVGVRRR